MGFKKYQTNLFNLLNFFFSGREERKKNLKKIILPKIILPKKIDQDS